MKYLVLKIIIILILISLMPWIGCKQRKDNTRIMVSDKIPDIKDLPPQPGEDTWKFIEDLKSPMWTQHTWKKSVSGPQQADLSKEELSLK